MKASQAQHICNLSSAQREAQVALGLLMGPVPQVLLCTLPGYADPFVTEISEIYL
jgi:hypothetical protein